MDRNPTRVLIIEDEDIIRRVLTAYLEDNDYEVLQAENGKVGLDLFRKHMPDIILSDLKMPVQGGKDVLAAVTRESPETPVIIVSGTGDISDAIETVHLGAWDYILKPILDLKVLDHAINKALERARLLRENRRYKEHLEDEIKRRTSELQDRYADMEMLNERLLKEIHVRTRAEESLKHTMEVLQKTIDGTISTLSALGEIRDPYTGGHQQRVAQLAVAIAQEMNLPDEQRRGIYIAGMLHDIGKMAVPIETLSKPGIIDDIEYLMMKIHPETGYQILSKIEFTWPIATIILQHHERLDGSGYPKGLKNDEILLDSRIISVADVVEAMASHRPYRPALGIDKALEEILQYRGTLYDPDVVDICERLFRKKEFRFMEAFKTAQRDPHLYRRN